jgi:hypothetical protein
MLPECTKVNSLLCTFLDLEDPGVDGRKILKWIFERLYGGHRLDRSGSGLGQVPGCCECGDETSGFIICGEFLE